MLWELNAGGDFNKATQLFFHFETDSLCNDEGVK